MTLYSQIDYRKNNQLSLIHTQINCDSLNKIMHHFFQCLCFRHSSKWNFLLKIDYLIKFSILPLQPRKVFTYKIKITSRKLLNNILTVILQNFLYEVELQVTTNKQALHFLSQQFQVSPSILFVLSVPSRATSKHNNEKHFGTQLQWRSSHFPAIWSSIPHSFSTHQRTQPSLSNLLPFVLQKQILGTWMFLAWPGGMFSI